MSNATDTPRKPGQQRRRRSRGGRNRNHNQNNPNRSQSGSGTQRTTGQSKSGRRPSRSRKPVKLTWWQKLLKALGLYKEPARGNRGTAKPPQATADKSPRPPKSNTRNARGRQGGEEKAPRSGGNRDRQRRGGDPSTVESGRVYVGNLSYDVTEQDLKELFKGVGTVRHVEIVYNRNTHRSKGYGFVEMIRREDAVRSVEVLHDQPFMGRNMTVSGAKIKTDGDEDESETPMIIKASDVELAPLPESSPEPAVVEQAPPVEAPAGDVEMPAVASAEPVEETPTESTDEEIRQA